MKTLALVLATLIAGSVAGLADASTAATHVRQRVVSYADLNLENPADAEILLGRIKSAARSVCGLRESGPLPLDFRVRQQSCAAAAVARAISDVDSRSIVVAAARD